MREGSRLYCRRYTCSRTCRRRIRGLQEIRKGAGCGTETVARGQAHDLGAVRCALRLRGRPPPGLSAAANSSTAAINTSNAPSNSSTAAISSSSPQQQQGSAVQAHECDTACGAAQDPAQLLACTGDSMTEEKHVGLDPVNFKGTGYADFLF
eukprot:2359476-Rhodomonas_salina.1